jgi:hypothetical protein
VHTSHTLKGVGWSGSELVIVGQHGLIVGRL